MSLLVCVVNDLISKMSLANGDQVKPVWTISHNGEFIRVKTTAEIISLFIPVAIMIASSVA